MNSLQPGASMLHPLSRYNVAADASVCLACLAALLLSDIRHGIRRIIEISCPDTQDVAFCSISRKRHSSLKAKRAGECADVKNTCPVKQNGKSGQRHTLRTNQSFERGFIHGK
jgi:hypothetical protein